MYQPHEVICICSAYPKGSNSRGKIITKMLNEKLVPVNRSGLYAMLGKHEEGKLVRDKWGEMGAPRLLKDKDMKEMNDLLTMKNGHSINDEFILNKIKERKKKDVKKQGLVALQIQNYELHPRTLINYSLVLA